MDIDWPLALAVLLIFLSWALAIYGDIYQFKALPLSTLADDVNKKILDFLKVSVFEVPVNYTSIVVDGSKVLYADIVWPEGTVNSTKVFKAAALQPCQLASNRVYWLTSVTNTGPNYFRLRITTQSQPQNCSGSFTTGNASLATAVAMEKLEMVTNQKIAEVTSKSYEAFKSNISVSRDFRIEFNISGSVTTYGPSLPNASDVSSKETVTRVEDTNQNAVITVFVW